jgi:hypothetical protein
MKMFNATCTRCGRLVSAPTAAWFVVDDPAQQSPTAWVVCPTCDDLVGLTLPPVMLAPLTKAGCHVLDTDACEPHPEQRPEGAVFSADDVLALHELLADDDALAAAVDELGVREA